MVRLHDETYSGLYKNSIRNKSVTIMTTYESEKRRFNRVPFSYHDNIIGIFTHPGKKGKFNAHLLNLSIQGIYFTLRKEEGSMIHRDDQLVFIEIKIPKGENYILNIDMEVRRILDHPDLDHFGYGCAFTSFPDSSREQLRRFLEMWFLEGRLE